ncbi:MAG: LytR C-terminal domain-containing protein [Microthrixaceae bacterium]|nr:LytR C-terminal domain-containing protein [Acidimicrobiales bacterium]MCB9403015.1 LytR C-terminal domain-containing protein [Microthrixaceae bacterium]
MAANASSEKKPGGFDANARGLAVLAVAVVVGLLLLLTSGGDGGTQVAAGGDGGPVTTIDISGLGDTEPGEVTTTTPDQTTTSSSAPTDGTRDPGEVKVLVLNGGGPAGTARSTSDTIGEKGYVMQPPSNAASNVTSTTVYYADGYQAEAEAVALVIGKAASAVKAMPSTTVGPGADKANVVVVLGPDTAPASSGSTTSSTN